MPDRGSERWNRIGQIVVFAQIHTSSPRETWVVAQVLRVVLKFLVQAADHRE